MSPDTWVAFRYFDNPVLPDELRGKYLIGVTMREGHDGSMWLVNVRSPVEAVDAVFQLMVPTKYLVKVPEIWNDVLDDFGERDSGWFPTGHFPVGNAWVGPGV